MTGFKRLAAKLLAATCLAAPLTLPLAPPVQAAPVIPAAVSQLYTDAAQKCGPITGGAQNPVIEKRIQEFNQTIGKSQTGRDLLAAAADYNGRPAWMCFENIKGLHAIYYTGQGVLGVGLSKTNDEVVADAAHELRHLFQEKAGLFAITPQNKADQVHLEYAGEADAEATASLVMWELKQAGNAGPWQKHNDHSNYGPRSICYAHISTAFKDAVERGVAPVDATQQAFRAWYRDRDLLSYYGRTAIEGVSKIHGFGFLDSRTARSSNCDAPDTERNNRHYEIPSDYIATKINGTVGSLPSYQINFVQKAGGYKAILAGP